MRTRLSVSFAVGATVGVAATWLAFVLASDPVDPVPYTPAQTSAAQVDRPGSTGRRPRSLSDIARMSNDFDRNSELYSLIARADQETVEKLAAEVQLLPQVPYRHDISRVLYVRFAALAPSAAADHVLALNPRPSLIAAVFRGWAHADLNAATARAALLEAIVAQAILDLDLFDWQRETVARQLDAKQLLARLLVSEEIHGGRAFPQIWQDALLDTDEASRLERIRQIARAWTADDPDAAMAAAEELTTKSIDVQRQIISDWLTVDAARALEWLVVKESSETKQMLIKSIMRDVVWRDVHMAISLVHQMPPEDRSQTAEALIGGLSSLTDQKRLSNVDFDAVVEWYVSLDLDVQEDHITRMATAYVRNRPEQAIDWLGSLDSRLREKALRTVVFDVAMQDDELARQLVDDISDIGLRKGAAMNLSIVLTRRDPREALRWAQSFRSSDERTALVASILSQWSRNDAETATETLLRLPRGPEREKALELVLHQQVRALRLDVAERLFDDIESEDTRRRIAALLHHHYTQTDPDAAKASRYREIVLSRR